MKRRIMQTTRARAIVAGVLLALLVLAVSVSQLIGNRTQPATGASAPDFGVLRQANGPDDGLTADQLGKLATDPMLADAVWSEARNAGSRAGFTLHVVPAGGRVCLVASSAETGINVNCDSRQDARQGALMARVATSGASTTLIGLVPDGVPSVSINGDPNRATAVSSNVFVLVAGSDKGSLEWVSEGQKVSVPLPPSPLTG
jgi:hypothetical protein